MSSSAAMLLYIGDDPAQVARLSGQLAEAGRSTTKVAQSLSLARGNVNAAWISDARDLCDRDVGVLVDGLPRLSAGLSTARAAVDRYQLALTAGRTDVDELRTRYDHAVARIDQSVATINGLVGSTKPADIATANTENALIRAAGNALTEVRADYQALLTKLTAVAQETQTALINSWNPTGQPAGTGAQAAGFMLLNRGGMGGTNLGALHLSQMDKLAQQAVSDLDGINEAAQSPEERNARIQSVLQDYSKYAKDPAFATALAGRLGQDYFRDLQSELGTYQNFWGAQDGNENYRLDSDLFKLSATVLANATDSTKAFHVDQKWINDLTHDEQGGIQPGWVVGISDYFRVGVPFSHGMLDSVGQDAIDWEQSRPDGTGDPWQGWGFERFHGSPPFSDPPPNGDPLTAVMQGFALQPAGDTTLLGSGPVDPQTGRPADPSQGNLMWLMHRQWGDDGAQLGSALDALTGPRRGDAAAAGNLAYDVIDAVTRGDDGLHRDNPWPAPSTLPDAARTGIATIAARYMGSILEQNGGQNADANGLLPSGIEGEGRVANVHFDQPHPNIPQTVKWLYADTDNDDIRKTLYSGWLTASSYGAAQDLQDAASANDQGNVPQTAAEVLELRTHTRASAQVLGLLQQSDIQAFEAEDAANAAATAGERGGYKSAAAVLKEAIGWTGPTGRALSAGVAIFSNLGVDALVTPDKLAPDATNTINGTSNAALDRMTASTVTALSDAGVPVISVFPDSGPMVVSSQTDVVTQDPGHLFTDNDGRLLPYDEIFAHRKGEAEADYYARTDAFQDWYGAHSYFGDSSGSGSWATEIAGGYADGQRAALK